MTTEFTKENVAAAERVINAYEVVKPCAACGIPANYHFNAEEKWVCKGCGDRYVRALRPKEILSVDKHGQCCGPLWVLFMERGGTITVTSKSKFISATVFSLELPPRKVRCGDGDNMAIAIVNALDALLETPNVAAA